MCAATWRGLAHPARANTPTTRANRCRRFPGVCRRTREPPGRSVAPAPASALHVIALEPSRGRGQRSGSRENGRKGVKRSTHEALSARGWPEHAGVSTSVMATRNDFVTCIVAASLTGVSGAFSPALISCPGTGFCRGRQLAMGSLKPILGGQRERQASLYDPSTPECARAPSAPPAPSAAMV